MYHPASARTHDPQLDQRRAQPVAGGEQEHGRDFLDWLGREADRLRQNVVWCRADLRDTGDGDGAAAIADAIACLDDAARALGALTPALAALRATLPPADRPAPRPRDR